MTVDLSDDLVRGIKGRRPRRRCHPVHVRARRLRRHAGPLVRAGGPHRRDGTRQPADRDDAVMGLFAETLALRVPVDREAPFSDVLRDVKRSALGAIAHHDVPFDEGRRAGAAPPRTSAGRRSSRRCSSTTRRRRRCWPCTGSPSICSTSTPAPPSSTCRCGCMERATGTSAMFEYSADLFDAGTVERLVGLLVRAPRRAPWPTRRSPSPACRS